MHLAPALADLADGQAGMLSGRQLRTRGVSRAVVRSQVRAQRWCRVHPGVYATFTGPLNDLARTWAALLYAGEDAVASHDCAEWLTGLRADLPPTVAVSVPHGRLSQPSRPGVHVRQSRRLESKRHPSRTPPQCSLDATVLDLVDDARTERHVIDVVLRACQQRRTTAARLSAAAGRGPGCGGAPW